MTILKLLIAHLDVKEDRSLGDDLRLFGLLLMIGLQALLSDPFLLLRLLFVITAEKINIIVIIIACCSGSSPGGIIRCILAGLSELFHTSSK